MLHKKLYVYVCVWQAVNKWNHEWHSPYMCNIHSYVCIIVRDNTHTYTNGIGNNMTHLSKIIFVDMVNCCLDFEFWISNLFEFGVHSFCLYSCFLWNRIRILNQVELLDRKREWEASKLNRIFGKTWYHFMFVYMRICVYVCMSVSFVLIESCKISISICICIRMRDCIFVRYSLIYKKLISMYEWMILEMDVNYVYMLY